MSEGMLNPYDFAAMTPQQRAALDQRLRLADAILHYRRMRAATGMAAGGTETEHASREIEQQGGIPAPVATQLARYRQWKNVTGGDVDFQGPLNINTGAPEKRETPEKTAENGAAFLRADSAERANLLAQGRLKDQREEDHFYDDLSVPVLNKTKPQQNTSNDEVLQKAKALMSRKAKPAKLSLNDDEALLRAMGDHYA